MKIWYTGIAVAVVLTGCYSFNRITIPDNEQSEQRIAKQVVKTLIDKIPKEAPKPVKPEPPPPVQNSEVMCRKYTLPKLPKTPELPLEQLSKLNKSDGAGLDAIQQQHIDDLRAYISELKKQLYGSYNAYLRDCYRQAGMAFPENGN